uniref:WAT1-related protein n=1 Tax=Oryza rufipogon TaxID=4529 RepID=A0A0E0Q957_ORYRU
MGNGKVYATVVLIRLIYAGMHILTKASFNEGASTTVFVFYRHAVAAIFLLPFAYFLEIRKKQAPPLTFRLSAKIFVHGFYGMAGTINLYSIGLNYASATSSSAIFNIVPVVAFILAVMFRMETLNLKSTHGMAKASGILLCIGGVIVLALYQGPEFKSLNHHQLLHHASAAAAHSKKNWALGIFLMTTSVVIWSFWTVKQGPLLLEYPSKLMNTTLQCVFASVQSLVIALVLERDFSRWILPGVVSLVGVLFTGIVVAAISYYLQIWVIEKKGPVFLSMSMPLSLVFTMAIASFLLGEDVSLGSIIGSLLLVAGLYNVLWGKSREEHGGGGGGVVGRPGAGAVVAGGGGEKEDAVAPSAADVVMAKV